VCASLTLEGGDRATEGAGASPRAAMAAWHVNAKGQFLKLRKDGEVGAPVSATSVLHLPLRSRNVPAVLVLLAIRRTIFSLSSQLRMV
jgi:hypothetical protein